MTPISLEALQRMADLADLMPWEKSQSEVPYADRKAFQDALSPDTAKKLIAAVQAAMAVDALVVPPIVEPAFAALRSALEPFTEEGR